MRLLWIMIFGAMFSIGTAWLTDFEKAKQTATSEHKLVLLNFSGSDWCGPCIRLSKEIFESDQFKKYSNDHLVLVNADFPRLKKHQLSDDQQKKNDGLAEVYNKQGIFPLTVLLTADGQVLKQWEGFPKLTPEDFTSQLKAFEDAAK
jgi:thioredoxin-related protein